MDVAPRGCLSFRAALRALALGTSTLTMFAVAATPACAQSKGATRTFSIAAQPLLGALAQFTQQSGVQVGYPPDLGNGIQSSGVSGTLSPAEALSRLLAGTGLTYRFTATGSATLEVAPKANDQAIQLGPVQVEADASEPATAPALGGNLRGPSSDPVAQRLNPQITIGTKILVRQREIPQSVTVITQDQLQQQSLLSLNDAISLTVPGVKVNTNGFDGGYYSRGFAVSSMMLDGVPTMLPSTIYQANTGLVGQYEQIEFLRGPAGLLNGFASAGGTLNLVRKTPGRDFALSAMVAGGTDNTARGQLDVSTPFNASGTLRGRFVATAQREDLDPHGTWRNNQQYYGIIQADLGPQTTLSVGASYDRRHERPGPWGGIPAYSDNQLLDISPKVDLAPSWNRETNETTNAFAELESHLGNGWTAKLAANYTVRTNRKAYTVYNAAIDPQTDDLTAYSLKNHNTDRQLSLDAYASGPFVLLGREHQLTVGATYGREHGRTAVTYCSQSDYTCPVTQSLASFDPSAIPEPDFSGPTSETNTITRQYGVYANTRLSITDQLTLIGGLRATWWNTSTYPTADKNPFSITASHGSYHGKITPFAGAVYDLSKTYSLYFSYATVFQPQTVRDTSNNLIKPIEGEQFEGGIKGEYLDGRLNAGLAVFQVTQSNQALSDPSDPTLTYYIAGGKARSRGIELTASGEIMPGWTLYGGYTYTDTKTFDSSSPGKQFSQIAPKHLFKIWSAYTLPGSLEKWTLGGGAYVSSKVYAYDDTGTWTQKAYATFNANISYRMTQQLNLAVSGTRVKTQSEY